MPTGRPQTRSLSITKPMVKSSYRPEGTTSFTKPRMIFRPVRLRFGSTNRVQPQRRYRNTGQGIACQYKTSSATMPGPPAPPRLLVAVAHDEARVVPPPSTRAAGSDRLTRERLLSPREHTVDSQKVLDHIRPIREAGIQAFFIRLPRRRARHPDLRGGTLVENRPETTDASLDGISVTPSGVLSLRSRPARAPPGSGLAAR